MPVLYKPLPMVTFSSFPGSREAAGLFKAGVEPDAVAGRFFGLDASEFTREVAGFRDLGFG